jgi:hypothetical protein
MTTLATDPALPNATPAARGWRALTIERTTTICLFLLVFALAARIPVDTDLFWHLRAGETTLSQGFIWQDSFSHSFAGQPWINHSWGAQVIMLLLFRAGGYFGLSLYMAGLATLGMCFVWRMGSGSVYMRAFVLILGAAAAAVFWSPRPQMLSFALSAAVLYILWLYRVRDTDRLWLLPLIMGVWGNLHAGFSIGFILMGGVIAGEALGNAFAPHRAHGLSWRRIGRLVLFALLSVAALLVNPYGPQLLAVPFQTVSIGALQNFIQEWNSPNFHERQVLPFLLLVVAAFGVVGASRLRLTWTDFLLFAGTLYLALNAGRNIALFAIVATPLLMTHLDSVLSERGWAMRTLQRVSLRLARLNLVIIGVVALAVLLRTAAVLVPPSVDAALRTIEPVDAVAYLRQSDAPRELFNSYNWGGYLIWAAPEYPVFVDGRTDLYGDAFLSEVYLPTTTGRDDWQAALDAYGINTVLVESMGGLARLLRLSNVWRIAYEDDMAIVAVRSEPLLVQDVP